MKGSKSLSWRRFRDRIANPRTQPGDRPTRVYQRLEVTRSGLQYHWRERGRKVNR